MDQTGQLNFTIFQYEEQLAMHTSPTVVVILSYYDELLFQIKAPPMLSCVEYEMRSGNNEWLYFEEIDEKTGKSPGFTLPGLFGLDTFSRVEQLQSN